MTEIILEKIEQEADIRDTYNVMKQLRDKLQKQEYVNAVQKMECKDYCLIAAFFRENITNQKKYIGLIGFSYDFRLSVGKMIYIEDLVVDKNYQNIGIGQKLINHVEKIARMENVQTLVLDSAIHRKKAHSFYDKLGFVNSSNNYKKFLSL